MQASGPIVAAIVSAVLEVSAANIQLYDEKKKYVDDDLIKEVEEKIATLLVEKL